VNELLLFTASFVTSFAGVAAFRFFVSKHAMLDVPNDRSLHETPMPRGGGVVIVLVSLLLYCFISIYLTHGISWGYLAGALLVASISWLDDLFSVSSIIRFSVHSVAAVLVIADLGYLSTIYVPGTGITLHLGTIGIAATFLWIVWMINAYNFMDGIDGIAGLQAVLASAGWMIFAFISGYDSIYLFAGILLFANLGFLIHNWSPAKIFMGDVGSAFLGFTFAALPAIALKEKPENSRILPFIAISFIWFFLFDTILTLTFRLMKRRKVWVAHREHIYQRLVISGRSHEFVAILYGSLTCVVIIAAIGFAAFNGIFGLFLIFIVAISTAALVLTGFRKIY